MAESSSEWARAFAWPFTLLDSASQLLCESTIDRSVFVKGAGSDSDFSGGAAGWEVAADLLTLLPEAAVCLWTCTHAHVANLACILT